MNFKRFIPHTVMVEILALWEIVQRIDIQEEIKVKVAIVQIVIVEVTHPEII